MYEHEEWRAAVAAMTEMDRAVTEMAVRQSVGMCGGPEDASDG